MKTIRTKDGILNGVWDALEMDTNIYKIAMNNNRMSKADMNYIDAVEASILDVYNTLNN